jgi:hypothetical protein
LYNLTYSKATNHKHKHKHTGFFFLFLLLFFFFFFLLFFVSSYKGKQLQIKVTATGSTSTARQSTSFFYKDTEMASKGEEAANYAIKVRRSSKGNKGGSRQDRSKDS